MIPSTARMTMTTTTPVISAIGSWNGIAAQVSLPSISTSRLLRRRTPGRAGGLVGTRRRLVDDVVEQLGLGRAIRRRRHGFARLRQFCVAGIVEHRAPAARLPDPGVEIAGGH